MTRTFIGRIPAGSGTAALGGRASWRRGRQRIGLNQRCRVVSASSILSRSRRVSSVEWKMGEAFKSVQMGGAPAQTKACDGCERRDGDSSVLPSEPMSDIVIDIVQRSECSRERGRVRVTEYSNAK
jgi:hypothetical protein